MSINSLTVFDFKSTQVRIISIDGEAWFLAKDVCDALELGQVSRACSRLDDEEKGITNVTTLGGNQTRK